MKLWRATDDDIITDCASFAETREAAEAYLDNPGYGGRALYVAEVEPERVLDLVDESDPVQRLADLLDIRHPGAIGADEWVPRICERIAEAGYEWVRVRESHPCDTVTWIWIAGDEPEMEEVNDG